MIVEEIMTRNVRVCAPEQDLGVVAHHMIEADCGFVPVVGSRGAVTGVITDRDICRAAARARRTLEHIVTREAMSHPAFACFKDEDVKTALATMAKYRVRRLTVIDKAGHLQGVLSIDDIVRARPAGGSPTSEDVIETLKAICVRRTIESVPA